MRDSATRTEPTTAPQLTLPTWAVGVPAVLLLGFLALLGRAGVGIQLFGLPLGAYLTPLPTAAVGILLVTRRGRALIRRFDRPQRRVAIAVGIAVGAGVLRAAAQGTPTLLRFQDMAYLLHLPWIIVGMAAMKTLRSDEERLRVLRWIAWTLALVLTLQWARGHIAPIGWLFEQLVSGLEVVSDKPDAFAGASSMAVVCVAAAALGVARTGNLTTGRRFLPSFAGLIAGVHLAVFVLGGSRGAALGTVSGLVTLMVLSRLKTFPIKALLVATASGFLISASILIAGATEAHTDLPPGAASNWMQSYQALAGRRALPETIDRLADADRRLAPRSGTEAWRLAIWRDVLTDWNASLSTRMLGIGFGNDVPAMTVPGRQGRDGLNRGVHSVFFTVLARQGVVGVMSLGMLLSSLVNVGAKRRFTSLPLLVTALLVSLFDVFMEGVQGPLVTWSVIGLLLGVTQFLGTSDKTHDPTSSLGSP